jgi:hypothetical protein
VPLRDRVRLERLCRYGLRPPVAADRLHLTADGHVVLDLRHRWVDGTSRLVFEPVELLQRLAALTPRARINLLLYYGVLGARVPRPYRSGDGSCSTARTTRPDTTPRPALCARAAAPSGELCLSRSLHVLD